MNLDKIVGMWQKMSRPFIDARLTEKNKELQSLREELTHTGNLLEETTRLLASQIAGEERTQIKLRQISDKYDALQTEYSLLQKKYEIIEYLDSAESLDDLFERTIHVFKQLGYDSRILKVESRPKNDGNEDDLYIIASSTPIFELKRKSVSTGEGLTGIAYLSKERIIANDVRAPEFKSMYVEDSPETKSEMVDSINKKYVLSLTNRNKDAFAGEILTIEEIVKEILIRQIKKGEKEEEKSKKDELTGLYNERKFYENLKSIWKEYRERRTGQLTNEPCAIVYIDLDEFKYINDTEGHKQGNAVLKDVANLLKDNLRRTDLVHRLHGDELVEILNSTDEESAIKVAEHLRKRIEELPYGISASIGIYIPTIEELRNTPITQETMETMVAKADAAMYHSKQDKGKNSVTAYSIISKK